MSMWYSFAKLSPELLASVRAQPDLVGSLLLDGEPPEGFTPETDRFGSDWLMLSEAAEAHATALGTPGEFWEQDTWMLKAVGGSGGDKLDFTFTYGNAWMLSPQQVAHFAEGLTAELAAGDATWPDNDATGFYRDELAAVAGFYTGAAAQGWGIVGGIT